MNEYTDAASRPGRKVGGTDDRELFLVEFGGLVLEAYRQALDYMEMRWIKQITQGKSDTFPIIGRKDDATEHVPGDRILGGTIDHGQVEITLDNMLVDSAFVPEIDELIAHYALMGPYATQIGQSLGITTSKRIAIMHILASRNFVTNDRPGQPVPAYYFHANLKTDASKLEDAAFLAKGYLLKNDVENAHSFMLPWQQVLLMARYTGIEGGPVTTGSGNRAAGTIGQVAGFVPKGTNHIPNTNITTGLAKYRGDFTPTVGHIGSKMAVGSLERRGLKVVMKEQEDRLGTILIGSQFSGHGALRNECSVELRTTAIGGRDDLATLAAA